MVGMLDFYTLRSLRSLFGPRSARSLALGLSTAVCAVTLLVSCGQSEVVSGEDEETSDGEGPTEADLTSPPRSSGPLVFSNRCASGKRITISALGDILLHSPLQTQAYSSPDKFGSLWNNVRSTLQKADLSYANFEGPAADGTASGGRQVADPGLRFDKVVYSSYPLFNYHPSLIDGVKEFGVDFVSTANNHANDRGSIGVDKTIDNMRSRGLAFAGTRRSNEEEKFYAVSEKNGIRIGWVACSFSTNGNPDPKKQTLLCSKDKAKILDIIKTLPEKERVDAVLVTPHWGNEYQHTPAAAEKALGRDFLNAGAKAVLGGHPHVLQPWEKVTMADGEERFIIYSLGNFVSGQVSAKMGVPTRTSLMLFLGLTKTASGKVVVNGAKYMPLAMTAKPWRVNPAPVGGDSYKWVDTMFGAENRIAADGDVNPASGCP